MRFARLAAGCAIVAVVSLLCTGDGASQDAKGKAKLPPGWDKLNLTVEQTEQLGKLQTEHKAAVDRLKDEIAKLDAELIRKRVALLTDEQRKKLRELPEPSPKGKEK